MIDSITHLHGVSALACVRPTLKHWRKKTSCGIFPSLSLLPQSDSVYVKILLWSDKSPALKSPPPINFSMYVYKSPLILKRQLTRIGYIPCPVHSPGSNPETMCMIQQHQEKLWYCIISPFISVCELKEGGTDRSDF